MAYTDAQKAYNASEAGKAAHKRYRDSEKGKAARKAYMERKKAEKQAKKANASTQKVASATATA